MARACCWVCWLIRKAWIGKPPYGREGRHIQEHGERKCSLRDFPPRRICAVRHREFRTHAPKPSTHLPGVRPSWRLNALMLKSASLFAGLDSEIAKADGDRKTPFPESGPVAGLS